MAPESLRERQAALARRAIFHALVKHLEAGDAHGIAMDDLPTEASVPRRTVERSMVLRLNKSEMAL